MGQENKKPTINKNTITQGTFSASSSQPTPTKKDNRIRDQKADYRAWFRANFREKLEQFNYSLDTNKIRFISAEIRNYFLEVRHWEISAEEIKKLEDEIINELLEAEANRKNTKELETSRTAEQEKRANYRLERDKLWEKHFEETESNEENFSPPEDYSDDEETEQTAEQSNEVKPVILKITPDQYLYAPGEKEQYEEVIPVIEKVIEVVEEVIPDTLPKKDKGKAKAVEIADYEYWVKVWQAEASTSKNTEPTEPKELSTESQQIIKLVNEILISDPTEPSGKDIADYFKTNPQEPEPEAETKPQNYLSKFIKKIQSPKSKLHTPLFITKTPKDNRLYYLNDDDRKIWVREYRGTDRIIAEKLRQKIGTYQISTADKIFSPFALSFPIAGNVVGPASPFVIDNLKIELEHSFSPAEVKEIVRQSNKESHEKLKGVENLLIRMEQDNSGKIANLQKTATEREAQKDKEFADLQKDKDTEIKKLKQQALDFIKQKQELETKKAEALGQSKKLLESKEKVDLDTITEKYRTLEQNATQQEQLLELKDKKITEFLAFIYQLKHEKEILGDEFSILIDRVLRIEAEKLLLDSELFAKSNELKRTIDKTQKDLELLTNSKDREIKRITDSKDRIIKDQDDALVSLTKDRTDLTNLLNTRDDELSKADREYQELEKDLKTPEIIHNFLYWVDWGLKTNLRKNTQSFWTKTKTIFRFSLLILVVCILLLLFTWIIRILVAIYRNGKAIFTKKQDTASVLKELIGGMKQAKDNLTNKKPTETTAKTKEKPEPKNIIEVLPEFTEAEIKENLRKLPPEERQIIKEAKKRAKLTKKKRTKQTKRTKEPTK
jgi:hypothetical protein